MKAYFRTILLIVGLLIFTAGRGELIPVASSGTIEHLFDQTVTHNGAAFIQADANANSDRWVICWWRKSIFFVGPGSVQCQLYAGSSTSNLLSAFDFPATATGAGIVDLKVKMLDSGGFMVLFGEDSSFWTRVFAVDGNSLMATELPMVNAGLQGHSGGIAPHANGFWVGGIFGMEEGVRALAYNSSGAYQGVIAYEAPPGGKAYCQGTLASNGDGDIMLAWIEKDINSSACWGKGQAKTYRPDGTAVSGIINFPAGGQVNFSRPQIDVDDSENFVIGFLGGDDFAYVSRVSPVHGMILAPTPTVFGVDYVLGAGSYGKDFLVVNRNVPSGQAGCNMQMRLFDEGLLNPTLQRSVGCVVSTSDTHVPAHTTTPLPDGSLLRAWLDHNAEDGQVKVWVQIFHHPVIAEISGMSLQEGNTGAPAPVATATVSLSGPHPTGEAISMNYYTRSDTAIENTDFVGVSGRLTIPGGQTEYAIEVPLIPENFYEENELFDVNINDPANVGIRIDSAKMTILNDDFSPPVENNCTTAYPGNCQVLQEPLPGNPADFVVTLSLTGPREKNIFINFSTADETATAGEDYVATSGQLHFPPETTSADITIPVLGDNLGEATETFVLQLSAAADVTLAEPVLRFAITDGPECLLTLSENGTVFDHNGGAGSVDMSFTHPTCQWTIDAVPSWVTVTSLMSGTGDATITYTVDSQAGVGMYPRLEAIVIGFGPPADQVNYEIEQEGDPSLCNFAITPAAPSLPVEGGDVVMDVSADPVCAWEVFSNVPWISIQQPTAPISGDGTLRFHVEANTDQPNISTPSRSAALDSPFPVTVQQAGCSYSLPVTTGNIGQAGGQLAVAVEAPTSDPGPCQWTAQSHDPWIVITNGHSGSGGGSVQLEMLENPSVQARTGTVSIGDDIYTVSQPGIACQYQLAPSQLEFCADGGNLSTMVQTHNGCDWQFTGEPVWLSIDNNPNGVGSETTAFSVLSNESEQPRNATVYLNSNAQNNAAVLSVSQSGYLVLEQFNSASLPSDWQFIEYLDPWSVQDGWLRGIGNAGAPANLGLAMALDNSSASYCADCKVEADVRTIFVTTAATSAGILGWYQNDDNQVRLSIDEVNNALVLEHINGGVTQSASVYADILPWQTYHLTLATSNGYLTGSLDGLEMIQLPISFPMAAGRFGVWVEGTRMEADEFRLLGQSAPLEFIFSGGFEAPDFSAQSVCTQ